MSPSEKVFQGPKVVVNRFGRYLAQKLSVIRYFKCHPGSLFRVFVLEFGGGGERGGSHLWPMEHQKFIL